MCINDIRHELGLSLHVLLHHAAFVFIYLVDCVVSFVSNLRSQSATYSLLSCNITSKKFKWSPVLAKDRTGSFQVISPQSQGDAFYWHILYNRFFKLICPCCYTKSQFIVFFMHLCLWWVWSVHAASVCEPLKPSSRHIYMHLCNSNQIKRFCFLGLLGANWKHSVRSWQN